MIAKQRSNRKGSKLYNAIKHGALSLVDHLMYCCINNVLYLPFQ